MPQGADDSEESEGGLGAVEDEGEFFQEFVPDSEMPASQVSTELGGENLVAPPRKVGVGGRSQLTGCGGEWVVNIYHNRWTRFK